MQQSVDEVSRRRPPDNVTDVYALLDTYAVKHELSAFRLTQMPRVSAPLQSGFWTTISVSYSTVGSEFMCA